VVDGAEVRNRSCGVVHQLEADERVVGQLEHRQAAELRLGDTAERGVPESGVEGERAFQVGDPEPEVQHAHARQATAPGDEATTPPAGAWTGN
jgi:hypothetical protein